MIKTRKDLNVFASFLFCIYFRCEQKGWNINWI